ncbi:MAG: hypothetical protein WCC82_00305 [Nitrososphaeraceae archaeon]|jgi:hypothetical protein
MIDSNGRTLCIQQNVSKINKDVASDITSNMVPLLLFGGLGSKGALMLGFAASEILMHYWNSRKIPPEVHILGRRVHHGEIGALLSVSSLLVGKVPIPAALFAILAGIGTGLIKDDLVDIKEWFRFKKMDLVKKGSK